MTTTDTTPWHLRDNWAPVFDERTDHELRVDGTIPTELNGTYVRTGPNPASGSSAHWFFGDGMLHGVRLRNGKAEWYKNRFVQTSNISDPKDMISTIGDLTRGTGNTHVVPHNGELLCLEEGHWPFRADTDLNTLGIQNYNGALTCAMTAHPKVCPETGELLAFSYMNAEPTFLHYIRVSADGQLKQQEGIELPKMVMMHDFNVTRNHVVFMDLPVCLNFEALKTGFPFMWEPDSGARLGVMPRTGGTNADVRWFEIDPCYVFHPVNAYEDGNRIIIHVSRQSSAFGTSSDDYSSVGRLARWTIDLTAGTVTEEQVDDRPGDFGRVDDRLVGLHARYGYLMAMAGEGQAEEPVYGSKLLKYDLLTGQCAEHALGDGVRGAEPVFAPASTAAGEDEGWIISLTHDTTSDQSRLIILDAQNFSAPPVATVHLPRRVPYGAHGNWVPNGLIAD